jgi:hypothetical protein
VEWCTFCPRRVATRAPRRQLIPTTVASRYPIAMSEAPNHAHKHNISEQVDADRRTVGDGPLRRAPDGHKPQLTGLGASRHDLWRGDRSNPAGLPNSEPDRRETVGEMMWNAVATGAGRTATWSAPTQRSQRWEELEQIPPDLDQAR